MIKHKFNSFLRIVILLLISLFGHSNIKGDCVVDFSNNSNLNISNSCSSTIQNLELGKNIPISTGDSFTFDSPSDIYIDGSLRIFATGNGKVIIPEGINVYVKGNFHNENVDGQCANGNQCSLTFEINGTLTVEGNFHNNINELLWSGRGLVNIISNLDNTTEGCMKCNDICPGFIDNGSCKDDGTCNTNFCSLKYGTQANEFNDNEPPVFEYCPSSIIAFTSESSCSAIVTWTEPIVIDNSGSFTLSSNFNSGNSFNKGTHTVTYTATDVAGNFSTCSFSVIVKDNVIPSHNSTCPQDIYRSGAQSISWTEPAFNDNCSISKIERSHKPGDFFNVGSHTVTYTAYDQNNNVETCSFNIIVQGISGPEITYCPNDIIVPVNSNCEAQAIWNEPTGDFSGVFSSSQNYYSGDIFQLGATNVEYSFTDINGTSICSFDVILVDESAPVISGVPNDITINTDKRGAVVSWTEPDVSDNCTATMTASHNPNDNFPEGNTIVKYIATDNSNNQSTEEFQINVIVNHPPAIQYDTLEVLKNDLVEVCPSFSDPDIDDVFINNYSINSSEGQILSSTSENKCLEILTSDIQSEFISINIEVCDTGTPSICSTGNFIVKFITPGESSAKIIPYKIFTPDNDSYNDTWIIENIETYPDNKVTVFDRWGRVVYEAAGYNNTSVVFNGKSNNSDIPTDTYFYNIIIGDNIKMQGYVELLR